MIRVLMVLGGPMGYGGTEAFLMNYYRHIDRSRVQFDFVYQGDKPGVYDDEIYTMGGKIFHVPFKSKHPLGFSKSLADVINSGNYKIVHCQMDAMNAWPLSIAKKCDVPLRISHSHSTKTQTNHDIQRTWNDIAKKRIPAVATDLWACSEAAGTWLYGKEIMNSGKVTVIHNAIDSERFAFNPESRDNIRSKYGIDTQTHVIGHIGRLSPQKNHDLILRIFAEVLKERQDTVLLLVGDGELREELEKQAKGLGIFEKVIFAGNQKNPAEFYNAMDIFLFPSRWEGLSITYLEAQVNGLFCICSDGVTKEGDISDALRFSVQDSPGMWSKAIIENWNRGRADNLDRLREKGYDINVEARKLEERYVKMAGNTK